jgi:hypothetical protein
MVDRRAIKHACGFGRLPQCPWGNLVNQFAHADLLDAKPQYAKGRLLPVTEISALIPIFGVLSFQA